MESLRHNKNRYERHFLQIESEKKSNNYITKYIKKSLYDDQRNIFLNLKRRNLIIIPAYTHIYMYKEILGMFDTLFAKKKRNVCLKYNRNSAYFI